MHHATGCCQHCRLPDLLRPPGAALPVCRPAPYPVSEATARQSLRGGYAANPKVTYRHLRSMSSTHGTLHATAGRRRRLTGASPSRSSYRSSSREACPALPPELFWSRLFAGGADRDPGASAQGRRSLPHLSSHSPPSVTRASTLIVGTGRRHSQEIPRDRFHDHHTLEIEQRPCQAHLVPPEHCNRLRKQAECRRNRHFGAFDATDSYTFVG